MVPWKWHAAAISLLMASALSLYLYTVNKYTIKPAQRSAPLPWVEASPEPWMDEPLCPCNAVRPPCKRRLVPNRNLCPGINRTYEMEARWPFPSFRIILETKLGACDLVNKRCDEYVTWKYPHPEPVVAEVLASFLQGCHKSRPCTFLDIGSTLGYYATLALSLGANATTVEPQRRLFRAYKETLCANNWQDQATQTNYGLLGLLQEKARNKFLAQAKGKPKVKVPVVPMLHVFKKVRCYDLIRVDQGGNDAELIGDLLKLVQRNRICVKALLVRLAPVHKSAMVLFRYFRDGYTVIKLNYHLDQRFFNRYGWDVYSNFKPLNLGPKFQEVFMARLIRYGLMLQNITSDQDMLDAMKSHRQAKLPFSVSGLYVVTNQQMFWPQYEMAAAAKYPSKERRAAGINGTAQVF